MAESDVDSEFENVSAAAGRVAKSTAGIKSSHSLDLLLDVKLQVTVEVGRTRMTIQDILQLGQGSVMELEKLAGEPLDVFVNGKQIARGEAVIVNEKFGIRLTEILSPDDRLDGVA